MEIKKMRKVKREISFARFLIVGLFAFLVFALGILLGFFIDAQRLIAAELEQKDQAINFESIQLQYLYLSRLEDKNSSCSAIQAIISKTLNDLDKERSTLEGYKDKSNINEADFEAVQKSYFINNLRYWMFSKDAKNYCDFKTLNIIYFYSDKECPRCEDQGVVLSYFKNIYKDDLLIFPINVDFRDSVSIIDMLYKTYGVTELPAMVIEEDLYEGISSKEDLEVAFCEHEKNFCN
jgi:hypothetical protein